MKFTPLKIGAQIRVKIGVVFVFFWQWDSAILTQVDKNRLKLFNRVLSTPRKRFYETESHGLPEITVKSDLMKNEKKSSFGNTLNWSFVTHRGATD